jgi:hypothetical protein
MDDATADAVALTVDEPGLDTRLIVAVVRRAPLSESFLARLEQIALLPARRIALLKLDRLPHTASGKPDRLALRGLARARGATTSAG